MFKIIINYILIYIANLIQMQYLIVMYCVFQVGLR